MRTNQRIKYGLITGAGLICLALLISWWLGNFELVEEQYRAGVSLEARRNPLLAVELFLREMGADVESVNGSSPLQKLPPPSDILLLNKFDGNLSPERERKLLDWINAGGQLFITANSLWNEKRKTSGNRFLDDLGVHLRLAKDIKATGLNQGENAVIDLNQNENVIVKVDFDDGSSARVAFNKYYYLEDSKKLASVSVGDESGVHMLQIPYGNGLITITSDNHFLNNPETFSFAGLTIENTSIADNDHAYFLWHLLDRNRKIWLIYNIHPPAITSLLWEKAPQVCGAFIILVVFWLWSTRNSFGPAMSAFDQPRRNLLENILMSTIFEWQQDRAHRRVWQNRKLLLKEIRSRHPNISSMDRAEKCEGLAKVSGMAAEKINSALYSEWKSEREFIQLTNFLRTLRQKL